MSDAVTYYELLNVQPSASADEIRSAYRRTVRTVHPDAAGGSAGLFRLVQEAYETLSDPAERARYDEWLSGPGVDDPPPTRGNGTTGASSTAGADAGATDSDGAGWGWGSERAYDPFTADRDLTRTQRWARGRGGFIATVISVSTTTTLGLLLAAMLVTRPDLLRPDEARPDVLADLVSVWWATLIAAAIYALFVLGAVIEGDPFESLGLFDVATLFGFLLWVGSYWDIATETEEDRFLWIVAIWFVYRLSVIPTCLLVNERRPP